MHLRGNKILSYLILSKYYEFYFLTILDNICNTDFLMDRRMKNVTFFVQKSKPGCDYEDEEFLLGGNRLPAPRLPRVHNPTIIFILPVVRKWSFWTILWESWSLLIRLSLLGYS